MKHHHRRNKYNEDFKIKFLLAECLKEKRSNLNRMLYMILAFYYEINLQILVLCVGKGGDGKTYLMNKLHGSKSDGILGEFVNVIANNYLNNSIIHVDEADKWYGWGLILKYLEQSQLDNITEYRALSENLCITCEDPKDDKHINTMNDYEHYMQQKLQMGIESIIGSFRSKFFNYFGTTGTLHIMNSNNDQISSHFAKLLNVKTDDLMFRRRVHVAYVSANVDTLYQNYINVKYPVLKDTSIVELYEKLANYIFSEKNEAECGCFKQIAFGLNNKTLSKFNSTQLSYLFCAIMDVIKIDPQKLLEAENFIHESPNTEYLFFNDEEEEADS